MSLVLLRAEQCNNHQIRRKTSAVEHRCPRLMTRRKHPLHCHSHRCHMPQALALSEGLHHILSPLAQPHLRCQQVPWMCWGLILQAAQEAAQVQHPRWLSGMAEPILQWNVISLSAEPHEGSEGKIDRPWQQAMPGANAYSWHPTMTVGPADLEAACTCQSSRSPAQTC